MVKMLLNVKTLNLRARILCRSYLVHEETLSSALHLLVNVHLIGPHELN